MRPSPRGPVRKVVFGGDPAKPRVAGEPDYFRRSGMQDALAAWLAREATNEAKLGALIVDKVVQNPALQDVWECEVGAQRRDQLQLENIVASWSAARRKRLAATQGPRRRRS